MERGYRVPGYPFLPAVFLVASLAMLAAAFVGEPTSALMDAVVILAGIPAFLLARRSLLSGVNGPSAPPGGA